MLVGAVVGRGVAARDELFQDGGGVSGGVRFVPLGEFGFLCGDFAAEGVSESALKEGDSLVVFVAIVFDIF